jgi:predicted alpha-1,2-mannosidase
VKYLFFCFISRSYHVVFTCLLPKTLNKIAGKKAVLAVLAAGLTWAIAPVGAADLNLTQYVNPFIGTKYALNTYESGNTNPGATVPFGMVNFSGDNVSGHSGYEYTKNTVTAFSMTRFSGRFYACYHDLGIMPTVGFTSDSPSPGTNWSTYSQTMTHGGSTEVATPGFYHVHLDTHNMDVDLTATKRTGFGKFTFPVNKDVALLFNTTHSAGLVSGSANVDSANRMITGTTKAGNCGGKFTYNVYFAAKFDRPFETFGTWNGSMVSNESTASGSGIQTGAYVRFDASTNRVVQVKVGISFVSLANAQANLNAENDPNSFAAPNDFNTVKANANADWNTKLNKIQVTGGTTNQKNVFYTALYHSHMHPNIWSDANGQYIGFDQTVRTVAAGRTQYQNFPGWDQSRSHMPLMATINPVESADMMYSLANNVTQDPSASSCIPHWQQASTTSQGMSGDSGSISVANMYAYGITNFDSTALLNAAYRGATDVNAKSDGLTCREGLRQWLSKGYVDTSGSSRAGSVTLEYAQTDFAVAQFAKLKGDMEKYNTLMPRSGNWINLWHSGATSGAHPYSGYLLSRKSDGSFNRSDIGSKNVYFHESSVEQYLWMVPHDRQGLIDTLGGKATTLKRLSDHFGTTKADLIGSYSSFNAFLANEPQILAPSTYAFVGAPAKGAEVWRRLLLNWWTNAPDGIPGNDDAGSMSSMMVFAAIGLNHAIPAVPGFVIGSPLFSGVTVHLAGGNTLQINAPVASDSNMYVQSMTLNGAAYNSPWLPWSAVQTGATIDFKLSDNAASSWGTDSALAPPSFPQPSSGALVFETESLAVAATSGDLHRVATDVGYSNGNGTILEANAVGDFVTYTVNVPKARSYDIRVGIKKSANRGIWQFDSSGVNHGSTVDAYDAGSAFTEVLIGSTSFTTAGNKSFKFTVTGKNANSTGYWLALDYIKLIPQ